MVQCSFSSIRSRLIVGSLRQKQFYSSQFCRGVHLLSSDVSRLTQYTHLSNYELIFLFLFSQVVPMFVFRHNLDPNHLRLAFLYLYVMFSTFSFSQMLSFLTWSFRLWPVAHLHIFISVASSMFTWELVIGNRFNYKREQGLPLNHFTIPEHPTHMFRN